MKKKSILIAVISIILVTVIIATVFIIRGYNAKELESEESIRTESEAKVGISIEFSYHEDYWQKYDLTNAVYKTQAEYETAVRDYINQIVILLNKQDWYEKYTGIETLYIGLNTNDADDSISEGAISFSKNLSKTVYTCDLHLSNTMFKHNRSQLVHALTELIITKTEGNTSSLEEGFCEYMQSNLGMGIGSYHYGLDIHNYLIEFTKKNKENADNNNNMNAIRDAVGDQKANSINRFASQKSYFNHDYWSSANYSFVDYLVNTYGIENVMKMMDGYDESIFYLFHQNGLSGMVADWEQYLEKYPCKLSWDEIQTQITGLKSTHGY